MIEARVNIKGRVQGVGFRPFIYRKAAKNKLKGYVKNLGDAGVEIILQGKKENIENFLSDVKTEAPQVSEIKETYIDYSSPEIKFKSFTIDKSKKSERAASGIFPPDIGICSECLDDIERSGSRWHNYPFTACAWCGPRYTSVKALPYDRERTHMASFPLCNYCDKEYLDPMNRRFDAQGITCSNCGPRMALYNSNSTIMRVQDVFYETSKLLKEGKIVAVKGIGGIHIAALATDDNIVSKLRKKKKRPSQPFAIMAQNLVNLEQFAFLTDEERYTITSWRKPIVLIEKYGDIISDLVAPGLNKIGVMLPYSGIHHMIFKHLDVPALIMTSGNKPGLPMAITNKIAFRELRELVDYFLLHDREIVNRIDDSVIKMIGYRKAFLRRSRGYVPNPIEIPIKKGFSLTVGAELSNTGAITNEGLCIPTQYLGEITNLESYEYERDTLKKLRNLLNITRNPDVIGCDLHPSYMTSHLAREISQVTNAPLVTSQHHHAHITSVCAENNIEPDQPVVGIALDGVGYGSDGAIWGGEVLISTYSKFERKGHLEYLPMPGGDLCTKYPLRMFISALTKTASDEEIRDITNNHIQEGLPHGERELELIIKNARDNKTIKTSSSGRFLDSISALTKICLKRTYEGEPAIKLESAAKKGNPENINFEPKIDKIKDNYILKTSKTLLFLSNILNKSNIYDIMAFGQKYLAFGLFKIACRVAKENNIDIIATSGGVLVNEYISNFIERSLKNEGFKPIFPIEMPPGDGGISLGQSMIALSNVI